MTKVTYNTYSCAISGMSREMMKMDGRDSAEYRIWEKRDILVILEIVNDNRTKRNSCLLKLKRSQNQKNVQGRCSRVRSDFLERERPPSL